MFPNPMPVPVNGIAQHYELESGDYFQHHDTQDKSDGALARLRRAEQITGGKGRILDIGAGRGELLRVARDEGWSPIGIEPSDSFAKHAEQHSGVEVRREPLEQCGFPDGSVDVVILSGVLEHLYNPAESIAEIASFVREAHSLWTCQTSAGFISGWGICISDYADAAGQ